ncbi:ATPase [Aureococcus anophagefferens]|nr:ATPase [Aureococcus anophagefferens]
MSMNAIPEPVQPASLELVLADYIKAEGVEVAETYKPILAYISNLASNQCLAETFHMFEWEKTCQAYLEPIMDAEKAAVGEGEILCNVEFKLAYGGKILLNTTHFHVRRGRIYGLLGHNGCGKSTLMRAISSGQLAGFPGAEELMKLRACFVDHDIDGSDANTPTIDFCLQEPILAPLGAKIHAKLLEMEFTEELIEKPICNLSGGWKMKLALARAVLLNADLLLLDEPTNHLDVQKQAWLCDFLTGPACEHVTTLVVSHDSKFLNKVLTDVIHYENMRLKRYTGNLDQFGVKSKTKAIIQAKNISFTYPGAKKPTLSDVSCQLSQASRVACIGPNGAGKSTLIKALVGETKPDAGSPEIYRHQNCRVAYVAQHAFHHIEQHLEMSPVEYIQWRFSGGLDKEQQAMEAAQMTDEEKAKLKQNFVIIFEKMEPLKAGQKPPPTDIQNGIFPDCVRQIKQLVGRRSRHGDYEYEVKWAKQDGTSMEDSKNLYLPKVVLESNGFFKLMKAIDDKIAAEAGNVKPLTTGCIQKHLDDFGLMEEFGTYGKMKNLSGGQKVKCVIGASMWFCPHLVILDEPTNYLDRDSLGALSRAIKDFEGGVLMISHNAEFFGDIAPEIWEIPGDQKVHISGAEWMEAVRARELAEQKLKKKAAPTQEEDKFDALGNKIESVTKAADVDRDMIKLMTKKLKGLKERLKKGDGSVEDEIFELEDKLDAANAMMKKEKEAAKAEKEAQKKLNKKEKAPADKKKATKKK